MEIRRADILQSAIIWSPVPPKIISKTEILWLLYEKDNGTRYSLCPPLKPLNKKNMVHPNNASYSDYKPIEELYIFLSDLLWRNLEYTSSCTFYLPKTP